MEADGGTRTYPHGGSRSMPACPDQPASVRQGSAPALHGSVYYHTEPMDETAFPDEEEEEEAILGA